MWKLSSNSKYLNYVVILNSSKIIFQVVIILKIWSRKHKRSVKKVQTTGVCVCVFMCLKQQQTGHVISGSPPPLTLKSPPSFSLLYVRCHYESAAFHNLQLKQVSGTNHCIICDSSACQRQENSCRWLERFEFKMAAFRQKESHNKNE